MDFRSILILGVSSCNESASKKVDQEKASENANKAATANAAMTFDKTSHDFGTIQEGETVQTTFTFTNTGQSDLIIVDARGSCGCTVPNYPKNTPIAPGASGDIVVSFDSVTSQTCNRKQ